MCCGKSRLVESGQKYRTLYTFYIIVSVTCSSVMWGELTVAFEWQQWLRERA